MLIFIKVFLKQIDKKHLILHSNMFLMNNDGCSNNSFVVVSQGVKPHPCKWKY